MTPHNSLISSLLSPTAYPHAVDEVSLVETHISWVLLAGEYAYKIKKPVDLGFVDFSTLEKRRSYCEKEIELNGRLAPDLYLGVVTITRDTNDRLRIEGKEEPIEYAVKMRRFSQDTLLSHLIEQDELTPRHIDSLARKVAQFHATTDVAAAETDFGAADAIWKPVAENFRHIPVPPDHKSRQTQLDQLRNWSEEEFQRRLPIFAARKAAGMIRQCHGDLHLGNMIVEDGEVELFDCIEFNESLHWIDVISEIAFTVMDLEDRGRPDLAYRFLNGYLERTGDYAGLAVLRYYLVYRATVRAKVAGIRYTQSEDEETKRDADEELQEYLNLAESYIKTEPPFILITHGVSGSGKSTVTQQFLETLPAIRLRSDVERKRLFPDEAPDEIRYASEATKQTYAALEKGARVAIEAGWTAIADATFLDRSQRDQFRRLASELGAKFLLLDITAPPNVLRDRVKQRAATGSDVSDADLQVLEAQLKAAGSLSPEEKDDCLTIDTTQPLDMEQLIQDIHSRRR